MCKFIIKNAFYRDKSIAYLYYDENKKEYDEFKLLVKNEGRSCQEECYIVGVEE